MIIKGAEPFFLPGGRHGVLLIHGFTGLPAELLLMGQFLQQKGFTVLGIRLAGHATTEEDMGHMTLEDWLDSARDGYAILRGCCEKISVVGHSMGGLLALLLAAEKHVAHVVTLAAPIFIDKRRGIEGLPPRRFCAHRSVPKTRRYLEHVPAAVNETYKLMPLLAVHELVDAINRTKKELSKVTAPLLAMHGLHDHTAEPQSAEYIVQHVSSAVREVFWLKESGHLLPLTEERNIVFQKAAAFLLSEPEEEQVNRDVKES